MTCDLTETLAFIRLLAIIRGTGTALLGEGASWRWP